MDETIDALSERLAPSRLMDEAAGWLRGGPSQGSRGADAAAIAKNVGCKVWEQAKQRPLSTALIGAGLAWMFFEKDTVQRARIHWNSREPEQYGGSYVDARTGKPYTSAYGKSYARESSGGGTSHLREGLEHVKDRASHAAQSARESMRDTAEKLSDRARHLSEHSREVTDSASRMMREHASSASHRAASAAEQMSHQAAAGYRYGRDKLWEAVDQYPLAVGGAALGLGLLLGLAAPRTRREDEWFGETADHLKEQGRDTGWEMVERGKHIAEATAAAVTEEAQKQGLTPSGLAEHAQNLASKVREDAREEGMTPGSMKEKVGSVVERAKETATEEAKGHSDQVKSEAKSAVQGQKTS